MASVVVQTLRAVFVADITKFQKNMRTAAQSATRASAKVRSAGKAMSVAVTLPLLAAGAAVIKFASDAEEQASKLGIVFGDNVKDIEDWAKGYDKATRFGIESTKSLASDIGAFSSSLGVSGESLIALSTGVVELAGDLASFSNKSPEQAFLAIQSALAGEREGLKLLAAGFNEAELSQELFNLGVEGGSKKASTAQKALATYNIILKKGALSLGDAARTSEGFANSLRGLKGRSKDAATSLGKILLPAATKMVNKAIELVGKFNALSDSTKKWIVGISAAAVILGPLLILVGLLVPAFTLMGSIAVGAFSLMTGAATIAAGAVNLALSPIMIPILAIGTALFALKLAWDAWGTNISLIVQDTYNRIKTFLQDKLGAVFEFVREKVQLLVDTFKRLLPDFVLKRIGLATEGIGELGKKLVEVGRSAASGVVDKISETANAALETTKGFIKQNILAAKELATQLISVGGTVKKTVEGMFDDVFDPQGRPLPLDLNTKRLLMEFATGVDPGPLDPATGEPFLKGGPTPFGADALAGAADPNKKDNKEDKSFLTALNQQLEGVLSTGQLVAESMSNIGDNMVDAALDGQNFGKVMAQMFKQLVRDILKAILKQLILKALMGVTGSFGGGSAGASVPALAHGGPLGGGQLALVGEQGPELFVPRTAGNIVPNNRLGGNVSVVVNNNADGTRATSEEGTNSMGEKEIRVFIETIAVESMSGGKLGRAAQQQFAGLRPATISR